MTEQEIETVKQALATIEYLYETVQAEFGKNEGEASRIEPVIEKLKALVQEQK